MMTDIAYSADGTKIVYHRMGSGPSVLPGRAELRVGHSAGGLVTLDTLAMAAHRIRAAALYEPPASLAGAPMRSGLVGG